MTASIEIAEFTSEHLDAAVTLSTSVGWSYQREDWAMLHTISKGYVAVLDGRVVGTAFRTDFGSNQSCINMVIVDHKVRGRGVGHMLTSKTLQTEGKRAHRLVATVSGKPLYRKLGFVDAAYVIQMNGYVGHVPKSYGVADANRADFTVVRDLDSAAFGGDRTALVRWLFEHAQVAVTRDQGQVSGYAAMRRFGPGYVIGPVVAHSMENAQNLILHLINQIPDQYVRIDIREETGLAPWLTGLGLSAVDRPPVMTLGTMTTSPTCWALFSQALS